MSRMHKVLTVLLCCVVTFSLMGCATIVKSKTTEIQINSDPQGANVYFDGNRVGKTPLLTTASNKYPLMVSLKKEGYEEISKRIDVHTAGGYLVADCFLPPLYGCAWIILDMCTKNSNTLNEAKLNFTLEPITNSTNK